MASQSDSATKLVAIRQQIGEPLAYIQGFVHFDGLRFAIDRRAYVPNVETENLVRYGSQWLTERGIERPVVVDVGTGCGNIAIAMAKRFPSGTVFGTDVLQDTLALARCNARVHQCSNITFVHTNLIEDLHPTVAPHLVLADLPYGSEQFLLRSNSVREMSHMPVISRFTIGLLDAYAELVDQILDTGWDTTLLAETGTVPKEAVREMVPSDLTWSYQCLKGYSITEIAFGNAEMSHAD